MTAFSRNFVEKPIHAYILAYLSISTILTFYTFAHTLQPPPYYKISLCVSFACFIHYKKINISTDLCNTLFYFPPQNKLYKVYN